MRDKIKSTTADLLVKYGYRGVSFREISEILSTTRANLHYHFGNKSGLVEEVLEDYARGTIERYTDVWTDPETTLREKIAATVAFNRERYNKFNPNGDKGHPWSLMIRLRSDRDALTPKMQSILQSTSHEFESLVRIGVGLAVRAGEFRENAPQQKIVIQLATIIHYAGSVTRDSGRFSRLSELWEATLSTIEAAYGTGAKAEPAARKPVRKKVPS
ncbi:TetR/AcrR family transcriptional regulator [Tardiphaga sp.]|jgi:TetR/AcrR family transcriptional repressor of nem operon|uniref:TetR/AcrR family transcriptional regulator n=1 Tax=Tardiphaga sp. TaxID=1926292 RepID=UPI0037DA5A1F